MMMIIVMIIITMMMMRKMKIMVNKNYYNNDHESKRSYHRQVILYNWLIWRVLKLAVFFSKKVFSLYLFWRLEQLEQRHLHVDIFLCDL